MRSLKDGCGHRKEVKPPVPLKGRLRINHSLFVGNYSNVEMEEQKVWNCNIEPLLLLMEKEMEDEVN